MVAVHEEVVEEVFPTPPAPTAPEDKGGSARRVWGFRAFRVMSSGFLLKATV